MKHYNTFRLVIALLFYSIISPQIIAQKNISLLGRYTYGAGVKCSNLTSYVDSAGREYALVGNTQGLSIVRIDTPTNPRQVFLVPGATGSSATWREVREYKGYAYVTTEQSSGLLVVDLRYLPDSIRYHTVRPGNMLTSHTIFIDENGIAYVNGTDRGQLFLDLDSNLWNPPLVGSFQNNYVHDCFARNDTLWNACVNSGYVKVVDVRNKAQASNTNRTIAVWNTPGNFTHNCWLSDDNKYLFTTDEVTSSVLACYEVTNLSNVRETARVKSTGAGNAIMHNAYFINDFVTSSYYTYGIAIFDVFRKNNLIEVGNYDTSPTTGGSFNGAWGVWPYLPSGNIIVSDIENGLWVLKPNYKRACYFEGQISDSLCGTLLSDVTVEIIGAGVTTKTNNQGMYVTGMPDSGTYTVRFSKPGYRTSDSLNVTFQNGVLTAINVQMVPLNTSRFTVITTDSATQDSLPFVRVLIQDTTGITYQEVATNQFAQYSFCDFVQNTYDFYAGRWGRQTVRERFPVITSIDSATIPTPPGYYDDFIIDYGWTTQTTATSGAWRRGKPIGTTNGTQQSNPGADVPGDFGNQCYVTGNNGGSASNDDVDNGFTILRSPLFDLTGYFEPHISYYRWFYNSGGTSTPNDSLIVTLSNGIDSVAVDVVTLSASQWTEKTIRVKDFITPTANMRIVFKAEDRNPGHLVEAGVDVFKVFGLIDTTVIIIDTTDTSKGDSTIVFIRPLRDSDVSVQAFPNPFKDELSISVLNFPSHHGELELTDGLGRVIHRQPMNGKNFTTTLQTRLPSGVYMLQFFDKKRLIQSLKVVRTE